MIPLEASSEKSSAYFIGAGYFVLWVSKAQCRKPSIYDS